MCTCGEFVKIEQMDVKTAFLYGLIDQLIYVEIPKVSEDQTNNGKVSAQGIIRSQTISTFLV